MAKQLFHQRRFARAKFSANVKDVAPGGQPVIEPSGFLGGSLEAKDPFKRS